MSDATLAKAPKLALDAEQRVIDLDTGERVEGIVVLNAQVPRDEASESPYTTLRRWSEFRQALVKPRL